MGFSATAGIGTISDAITRGDDVFIFQGLADRSYANDLDIFTNVCAVMIGPRSDLDFVDLLFELPGEEGGNDLSLRVGVGAPWIGRIPLNYALGETVLLTARPTGIQSYGNTNALRDIQAVANDLPVCQAELLFFLRPPPFVAQKRPPKTWSRGNGGLGGGIPVNTGLPPGPVPALYAWATGRKNIELVVQGNPADAPTDPVTVTLRSTKFSDGGLQERDETFTLAAGSSDILAWSRCRDNASFFPDFFTIYTQSVGTGRLIGFVEVQD